MYVTSFRCTPRDSSVVRLWYTFIRIYVCVSVYQLYIGLYVVIIIFFFYYLLSLIDEKTTIFPTKETYYCSKRVHDCETKIRNSRFRTPSLRRRCRWRGGGRTKKTIGNGWKNTKKRSVYHGQLNCLMEFRRRYCYSAALEYMCAYKCVCVRAFA